MENYDLFGDDLASGMLDSLAELGGSEGFGGPATQPSTNSGRQGTGSEGMMQNFNPPPSYTQIGQGIDPGGNKMNPNPGYPDYSAQYAQYGGGGQGGLSSYGIPPSAQTPSRPMPAYPPYHQSHSIPSPNIHYQDYSVQSMRPTPREVPPPSQPLVPPSNRMPTPASLPSHLNQQQFPGYRAPSQDLYAQQVHRWNEQQQQQYAHHYPPNPAPSSGYRQPHAYSPNIPRPPQQQAGIPSQNPQQIPNQQNGPHSMSPYMTRTQGMPTPQYPSMYGNSAQQYPDYHHNSGSRGGPAPGYASSHHGQHYGAMGPQHAQYGSGYGQYYPSAQGAAQPPQTPGSSPLPGSYPASYSSHGPLPLPNGNVGYRPPGPAYAQLPQLSPRQPTPSPRPPAPSPRPSAPSTPTIPMSPAQQQGLVQQGLVQQSSVAGAPSSLQQLEQMVMPHVSKSSPSPKPHLPSGVMSPKTPMSPGMVGPKTPLSPPQWQPPPLSRSSQAAVNVKQQQQQCYPSPQQQQQQQHIRQPSPSPGSLHPHISHSSQHASLENSGRCSDSSDLDQLTSTLDTNAPEISNTEEMKPSTPFAAEGDPPSSTVQENSSSSGGAAGNEQNSSDNLIPGGTAEENARFQHSTKPLTESPTNESESNLGNVNNASNMELNSAQSQLSNSSGDSNNFHQQSSASPLNNSKNLTGNTQHSSGSGGNSDIMNQQQQFGLNSRTQLGSLPTSGSGSPLPPNSTQQQLSSIGTSSHSQNSGGMMSYSGSGPSQSLHPSSYGPGNRNMTPPAMPNQGQLSAPSPHQYSPAFSQSGTSAGPDLPSQGGQPGYYHSTPPYQPQYHPTIRPNVPNQHSIGLGHGPIPPEALQYEIHQIQTQLSHHYSNPPNQQTQIQIGELQERLRALQQQASRVAYSGMHPQHAVPPMYGQSQHPGLGPDVGMEFQSDQDDFTSKAKKKKARKPREPKVGKGKGKGNKDSAPDFEALGQPPMPAFGGPPALPASHEIYDFQDIPPEIPEKKMKKPRKPRESKSPKEKKLKEPKPIKEKSPKKSRKKKGNEESPVTFQPPPDTFSLDSNSCLIKIEENSEPDQKNGIGAAGIIEAEGVLSLPAAVTSVEADTSTQDGIFASTDASSPHTTGADTMSIEPLPDELFSPQKSPKKKSKPKMKSNSGSGKKRPTKTTLIASLAAKKKKKKKGSDSEGCSDLDATPPPSPPPEEENTNKRRSGRHSNRKKYIDDVLACLSDEDLIVPPKPSASPAKSSEPTTPRPAGSETPVYSGMTPGSNVTPIASSVPTPLNADDSSSQGPTKPNFVFVNPAEEDTMIIQHILSFRIGKRDIVADSTDDEEERETEKLDNENREDDIEEKGKGENEDINHGRPKEMTDIETQSKEIDNQKSSKVKTKRERVLETVEVEEYYVKYKNFSYLHCEWKTEEELMKGDKRAIAKIRRYRQKMNSRDVFEFLEEDPFNPEYIEVDRILDMSEVRDPASGNIAKNYLVKWRALPYDECTWELADDIDPDKLKQFHAFYNPPPRDQWKPKRRPKACEWVKLEESPIYKNENTLRAYQLEGLNWLSFSWFNGRNCILADEMGLGKTIQSLTFVEAVHQYGIRGPFLIIAPLSTVPNWQREFETWTDLNVVVYHGSVASRNMIQEYELFYRHPDNPQMNIKDVYKFNVMITTFEIVLTDVLDLKDFPWRLCIIDEAHRLKNKNCKLLEGLRLLNLEHRVLLSGTPLQNNINELFSLLNFLEPSQFSSDDNFKKEFGELTTETQVQKLQALLKPMMLRRLKEDVEKSIAPKEETIVEVELTNMQKKYYRGILEKNFSFLSKGTTAANIPNLMNTMMELRKCCIHPYLLNGAEEEIQRDYRIVNGGPDDNDLYYKALVSSSGKMVLVDKLLPKLKANGHRVLIFSQMVRCLDILEDYLIYMKYPFERIDGRIRGPFRQAAIDRFSKPDSDRFVFLLCTKAGGLGINLTAADTVIIYDSDWNPQNDLQAQARCHRIGQAKMVKVYRLICRSTYEREMFDRASLKLGLDKAVLQSMNTSQGSSGKGFDTSANKQLSKKEVEDLLKKGAYGALMDEDNAGDKFCEEDIDCILSRRTQVITLETGEKGSTFSKASFASTGIREDINLDDPDFWTKWAKKAEIDMDEHGQKNELVIHEPRRRTQIKRYGHDDALMEISELESTSDSDEDGNIGERTRGRGGKRIKGKQRRSRRGVDEDFHVDDGIVDYGRWSRSECYKIEKGLLTFGWARWKEILAFGQFRIGWMEKDIEDCARIILVHCINNFRGDEKVRSFVQDLIFPGDGAGKLTRSHLGLANPVSRGGRKSRKKPREAVPSPEPPVEWLKDEKYDPDVHLDVNYKKHIGKHSNKVLLRIRMLYYIKQEIIGDWASKISANMPLSDIQICPQTLIVDSGPTPWWDRDADTSLLIGTYKHGYERYNMMRMDPNLCYLARCGPPDGSAVLAEISSDVNEEDMDKVGGDDDDDESCLDSISEKQPPSVGSGIASGEPSENGKFLWPSGTDLNTRLRKLITAFQRNFKKEEVRNAQKAKRQERKEKIDQIVREREKQKLEIYQKRWSKKEEADFFRTVSTYGVQYNRKERRYDWSKFRAISRLDKKFDETLTEYHRAFYAMCKRVSGKKLTEEEDLIQVPVEPVSEERARRTLERIDLLSKIREEIIYHPQLEERLKLCQPSLDMPDWWVTGKHDKDLLFGAARHGLGRTDVFYLNDPDLSFREILRRHIAGEPLVESPEKPDKKSKGEDPERRGKRDMVDIEIKDIKKERADAKRQKEAVEAAESETIEAQEKRTEEEKEVVGMEEEKQGVTEEEPMEESEEARQFPSEAHSLPESDVVIKKEPVDANEETSENLTEEKHESSHSNEEKVEPETVVETEPPQEAVPTASEEVSQTVKQEHEDTIEKENEDQEPSTKRRKLDENAASTGKSPADYSAKGKRDDEESTKSSGSELNEVQVEIKDEFKITIKLPAEKMKKVEVQVKGSPKFSVPEPPAPPPAHYHPEELTLQQMKLFLNPENLSGDNLEALGNLMNQMNPIRWPRDRAVQIRLEHIIHAVEKGEWPVSRFFTSAGLADMFEYTPQGTPDNATPARDTPTPISECSDLAPPEDLIMTLPASSGPTHTTGPSRRGRRRRIAIDVETERAKLQALLNHGLSHSNLLPQMQRLNSLRASNSGPMDKEDSSEGETPRNSRSKFQPPPAHQHHNPTITSSLLRSSHSKSQLNQQGSQHRQSPSPRFSQQSQGSSLDLSFKPTDRGSIAAAAMSALSSLSSVTVTPVTLQSPSSSSNNNSAPMDLSSTRGSNSRRDRDRGRTTPQISEKQQTTQESSSAEKPKQSKLENMLDKLRKRTLGEEAETGPLPVEKEKRRKKLDEIVLGLSASKGQSTLFSPPTARGTRGSSPASSASTSRLQSPPMTISAAASAAAAAHQQNSKDIATSQANMFNNSLLSATLSLFNTAAGKEFSRQLAGQAAASTSMGKGKEGLQRSNLPGPSTLSEMPKCDFSRLAELAVPKFDLFSQDAKVNKWLAEHANLTPERPVSPELLDGRRRRRPRVDPMLLDYNKLTGDEHVTVINRITGKKITGPKAPQLKHLAQWLSENPAFDVDPRWSDLVRDKGNLPNDLQRRVPGGSGGEKKKGPGRPPMLGTPPATTSGSASVPTSSSNVYSSLGAFSSLPGLSGINPNLLASLPLGSLDPKNPLFMPFGGLGSLGGLGNISSLGNLGSLGNLSSLGLNNPLFGFGMPGMEMDKQGKDPPHTTSGSTGQSASGAGKKDEKKPKSGSSASLASQNMLSSALPFLFPNPGLMYNPLGLGSFPLGMNPNSFGGMNSSGLTNGLGTTAGSGGKKGSKAASGSSLGLAGLAGLNIPSLSKKETNSGVSEKGTGRGRNSGGNASSTEQPGTSHVAPTATPNPDDSDDESMKSLMGNHTDDLPEEDSPGENAERIVLKESKELEKEMAQQKMETRRERRVRDRSSLLADAPRGGLTAAERQLLMVKKKERLAKEDPQPGSGRTTRRSVAAASRSRIDEAVSKMRGSDQSGEN